MNQDLSIRTLLPALKAKAKGVVRYAGLLLFIFIAGAYIFILLRINMVATSDPDTGTTQAEVQKLHVNESVVSQLQQLKDNSVSVQTLFDQARSNPFNE